MKKIFALLGLSFLTGSIFAASNVTSDGGFGAPVAENLNTDESNDSDNDLSFSVGGAYRWIWSSTSDPIMVFSNNWTGDSEKAEGTITDNASPPVTQTNAVWAKIGDKRNTPSSIGDFAKDLKVKAPGKRAGWGFVMNVAYARRLGNSPFFAGVGVDASFFPFKKYAQVYGFDTDALAQKIKDGKNEEMSLLIRGTGKVQYQIDPTSGTRYGITEPQSIADAQKANLLKGQKNGNAGAVPVSFGILNTYTVRLPMALSYKSGLFSVSASIAPGINRINGKACVGSKENVIDFNGCLPSIGLSGYLGSQFKFGMASFGLKLSAGIDWLKTATLISKDRAGKQGWFDFNIRDKLEAKADTFAKDTRNAMVCSDNPSFDVTKAALKTLGVDLKDVNAVVVAPTASVRNTIVTASASLTFSY